MRFAVVGMGGYARSHLGSAADIEGSKPTYSLLTVLTLPVQNRYIIAPFRYKTINYRIPPKAHPNRFVHFHNMRKTQ